MPVTQAAQLALLAAELGRQYGPRVAQQIIAAARRQGGRFMSKIAKSRGAGYAAAAASATAGAAGVTRTRSGRRVGGIRPVKGTKLRGSQMSSMKKTYGRKPRATVNQNAKLLKAATGTVIQRYQGLNEYNTSQGGYYKLSNRLSGDGLNQVCPLHMFDLSSCATLSDAAVVSPNPHDHLWFNVNNHAQFVTLSNIGPDGNIINPGEWRIEHGNDPNTAPGNVAASRYAYMGQRSLLKWSDIRLVCYGARNQPTRYTIEIVQFNHEYLAPQAAPSTEKAEVRAAFYQNLVKQYMHSPIDHAGNVIKGGLKVLHREDFVIQPDTSINLDTAAPNKVVKIFKYFNRLHDWTWRARANNVIADPPNQDLNDPVYNTDHKGDQNGRVAPRARIFLMIRAMNTTPVAFNEETIANTPSYDLMIRQKWAVPT